MEVRVKLFAGVRDAFGRPELTVTLAEDATAADLLRHLRDAEPDADSLLFACRVAVDHEFVSSASALPAGAEVAVIPPVSGG
jgi:molybdopterin converting factor subunit 1